MVGLKLERPVQVLQNGVEFMDSMVGLKETDEEAYHAGYQTFMDPMEGLKAIKKLPPALIPVGFMDPMVGLRAM